MKQKIIGYAPKKIKTIGNFTVFKNTPYFKEIVCSSGSFFKNKKTNEILGERVYLFIYTEDQFENKLEEENYIYDSLEDIVLVNSLGREHEVL